MAVQPTKHSLVERVRQSPPLDIQDITDDSWVKGKTIVITGGASGFGAGFLRRWAKAGAVVIIGDINFKKGNQVIQKLRIETENQNLHFVYCDVADWLSQVNLFKEAVKFSPHGDIDTVVANAGIIEKKQEIENPKDLDADKPPSPNIDVLDVTLKGVVYTIHLAFFWLARNPGSSPASPKCDPAQIHRDRHLILLGSVASLIPMPSAALYGAAKHGVLGLWRCLRASSFVHGIRINLICPYFIDTPLIPFKARIMLAGGTVGDVDDVVKAATRFAVDPRIVGRAVHVGPKLKFEQNEDGEWSLAEGSGGEEKAIWEIYMHDFEDSDIFQRNVIGVMNRAIEIRSWTGWAGDVIEAVIYAVKAWWKF